uniref:Uncharacterized protein n=1 Tax=Timema bartmani TaxID=61472 RepID=A0A7R9F7L8_9NEOP|nr:unnamed protein product [Timema bartmani]
MLVYAVKELTAETKVIGDTLKEIVETLNKKLMKTTATYFLDILGDQLERPTNRASKFAMYAGHVCRPKLMAASLISSTSKLPQGMDTPGQGQEADDSSSEHSVCSVTASPLVVYSHWGNFTCQ